MTSSISDLLSLRCLWYPHASVKSIDEYLGQKSKGERCNVGMDLWKLI